MQSNGDVGAYWRVLSDAGVTKERLESFDRPIVCQPEFFGDKKDELIREFRNYLGILKSVHSGGWDVCNCWASAAVCCLAWIHLHLHGDLV